MDALLRIFFEHCYLGVTGRGMIVAMGKALQISARIIVVPASQAQS
jgi:hypothetical protein